MEIENLSIDIETFSDEDLSKVGVYKYSESKLFEILLFGVSVNNQEVIVYDLARGDTIPEYIVQAILNKDVIKWAFNASFERICISRYLMSKGLIKDYLDPESWRCSMIWSAYLGLPFSLASVGMVLGLEEQKLKEGKELIRYFCVPCKATKVNKDRTRNMPEDDIEKWNKFIKYNVRDVEVEIAIKSKLHNYPVPDFVWEEYCLDQLINDRGILVDTNMVKNAIEFDEIFKEKVNKLLKDITGIENPNSVMQMKQWLADNGYPMDSLGKKEIEKAIKIAPKEISDVLKLRKMIAKSSIKKYHAMKNAICNDHRARGMFMFYGANRTGRFSGRIIQLQNLPQNHMSDLEDARDIVCSGNYEAFELLYDVSDTLSQLIRTAFIPHPGMKYIVADFSAIEARVLSFIAGERWRSEVFESGGDIYCASASQMFGVPVVKNGINGNLRQKGKIAELALGYGGSVGALKSMGAVDMGMNEEELQPLVDMWRTSNPKIVEFWWEVDRAVKKAVQLRIPSEVNGIKFFYQGGMLFIQLPSGRCLTYVKPRMGENKFGGESVTYEGIGATKKWERLESYGPKFVENIVQGISRDILMYAMDNLSLFRICAHVHDEVIIECHKDMSVEYICNLMSKNPPWLPGIKLRADGYECRFYQKD